MSREYSKITNVFLISFDDCHPSKPMKTTFCSERKVTSYKLNSQDFIPGRCDENASLRLYAIMTVTAKPVAYHMCAFPGE
jgi:hypothetical protein